MRKQIVTLAAGLLLAQFSNGAFAQQAAAAAWAGWARCQVSVQGPGYTDQQTHTWTISGGAPTVQGAFLIYAGTWAVVGGGSLSRSQGTQTLRAQWATNGSNLSAPIAVFVRASDRRMFIQARHTQLRSVAAIQGFQQVTINGVPQTPGKIAAEAFEWAFPVIAVSAPVPPDTNATANGSSTSPANGGVGPMQPAGSQGTASCTWQFGQGSAAPAPPPTLTAQAIPTPANPATTSPTANNPSSATPPPGNTTPPGATTPPGSSTPPDNPSVARLLSVSPATVEQGVNVSDAITLTGEGTHWQQGTTTVDFGPGITNQGAVRVSSPTSLTTHFSVSYAAASGPRAVTATTGNETVTLPNALTITAREQPVISQISPDSAAAGAQNVTVTFTGRGTRWAQGRTALLLQDAAGVTQASALSITSPTSMTVSLNIASSATPGPREITVLNSGVVVGSDIIRVADGFTVNPPSMVAVPISPGVLPLPILCTLRGPGPSTLGSNYTTPGAAHLYWQALGGATGYTVSRSDLGMLTSQPLPASATSFVHYAALPHPGTYVYTVTATYPQGCGKTDFSLDSQRPLTPEVYARMESQAGRVRLTWSWPPRTSYAHSAGDYTGVLITGSALPSTGREVRQNNIAGDHLLIDGVPAGRQTWTVKTYWDTPTGRVIDNTGKTITATVP